ncbi:hypothetical protein EV175_004652 [Coemansia sp. RSA 1933]|nr:hypothetical protein EV175_004652 [Coemansia sp. RSA 1933]
MFRRIASTAWKYKKSTLAISGGLFVSYKVYAYFTYVYEIQPRTVLTWRIAHGLIVESPTTVKAGGGPLVEKWINDSIRNRDEVTILEALTSLELAAKDPRVEAIVIDLATDPDDKSSLPGCTGLSMAQVQELRTALISFSEQKKKQHGPEGGRIYFFADSFTEQNAYYLASACSDIIVQPLGSVPLTGVSSTHFFTKRLSDNLGVKIHTESRKDYKSFASMFSETKLPENQRKNRVSINESLNDILAADIAACRRVGVSAPLTANIVRDAMAIGPLSASEAVDKNLISRCGCALDVNSIVGPRTKCGISLYRYAREHELKNKASGSTEAIVGLVHLGGMIARNGANSARLTANTLIDVAMKPDISAVVFRIDSGGGDPVASETIAYAIDYIQNSLGKPVVASYSSTAASGAVLASAMCRKIYADPATITGSIGVESMRPTITTKLLDNVGLNVEEIRTVDNRSTSPFSELSESELLRHKKRIDDLYDDFVGRVAKGRNYTPEQAEAVAQGQVYTGIQAKENGLVDELGGLTRAIEDAAQLGRPTDNKFRADITENVTVFVATDNIKTPLRNKMALQMRMEMGPGLQSILSQLSWHDLQAQLKAIFFK